MTDAEISRRLALAIGWKGEQIIDYPGQEYIGLPVWIFGDRIKLFSYRWPSVIWPIAERFNAFPAKWQNEWNAGGGWQDTAAKAVALAVIKAHEGAKE